MQLWFSLVTAILAPVSLAAPARDVSLRHEPFYKRENLCNLSAPPALCQPDPTISVEETALRAYKFYRAFVVDGDPRTMFSLIDSSYIVSGYPKSELAQCRTCIRGRTEADQLIPPNSNIIQDSKYSSGSNSSRAGPSTV
jgi:hypothetical protein